MFVVLDRKENLYNMVVNDGGRKKKLRHVPILVEGFNANVPDNNDETNTYAQFNTISIKENRSSKPYPNSESKIENDTKVRQAKPTNMPPPDWNWGRCKKVKEKQLEPKARPSNSHQ
jgi:hypothetical protein